MTLQGVTELAIIAGAGRLPHDVALAATAQGIRVFVIALRNFAESGWLAEFDHQWFALGDVQGQLDILSQHNIRHLVMAGAVQRPGLGDLRLDWRAASILLQAARKGAGDDGLLQMVQHFLEKQGITVLGAHQILTNAQAQNGMMAGAISDPAITNDINRGIAVTRMLGQLDVGQGCVVHDGVVLAVEAAEGTDAMINRARNVRTSPKGGVLVKLRKPAQDDRMDLPTIGPETIKAAAAAGLCGIVIEANANLVIDQEEVLRLARLHDIFILSIPRDCQYWSPT